MTDEQTPTPAVAETFVCPVEDCRALIPDTLEDRRGHRRGHEHRDKVDEAIRGALRVIRTDFGRLRGETKDAVKRVEDAVAGIDRAVGKIEIPEPTPPTTVRRGGWDDDEDEDDGQPAAANVDDEWGDLLTPTTIDGSVDQPAETAGPTDAGGFDHHHQQQARADAVAAFTVPDEDGYFTGVRP
jgi:hypothetical protein